MMGLSRSSRWALVLILACMCVAGVRLWHSTHRDPKVAYLTSDAEAGARWIGYPHGIDVNGRPLRTMSTVFERRFSLPAVPATAHIRCRALSACRIHVNGEPLIDLADWPANWRRVMTFDVSGLLRAGDNVVTAEVENATGPPMLWLALTGPDVAIGTDATWRASLMGATEDQARVADAPLDPRMIDPTGDRPTTVQAVRAVWPTWLLLAVMALAGAVVVELARVRGWCVRRAGQVVLVCVTILWIAMFISNARFLWWQDGFDAAAHLEYVAYILKHGALPLADEGFAMFHPPLYYALGAGVLALGGWSEITPGAVTALRMMSLAFGIAQVTLLYGCMRVLFAHRPGRAFVGLVIAAFLPMHLYLYHYPTNETLSATLCTASIYLALRLLRNRKERVGVYALLGLVLGLAMLAKVTALLVLASVTMVLAGRLVVRRTRVSVAVACLGTMLAVCLGVCGWHYARVTMHFGTPFVGHWHEALGFHMWQDPGYQTSGYFLRFGQSILDPLFAGFATLPDGLYSTMWGDGLIGSAAGQWYFVPWRLEPMTAGYLLAIVPLAMMLIGGVVMLTSLVRRPRAAWFLLLGLTFGMAMALVSLNLRMPTYAHAKAFFSLSAIVFAVAAAGLGYEVLSRRGRTVRIVVTALLGLWAANACITFWIADDARSHARLGRLALEVDGDRDLARRELDRALRIDPENLSALIGHASLQVRANEYDQAQATLERASQHHGDQPELMMKLAQFAATRGRIDEAIEQLDALTAKVPHAGQAYYLLTRLHYMQRNVDACLTAGREALRYDPWNAEVHAALAQLYRIKGDSQGAILHEHILERIKAGP